MSELNSMYFSKDDIEKGVLTEYLNGLIKYNQLSDEHYLDIHIKHEDCAMIVEWVQNSYDYEFSKFQLINEEEVVMKEVHLPDNQCEYARDEEEEKEIWNDWISKHSNWEKNQWGIWHEKIEPEEL